MPEKLSTLSVGGVCQLLQRLDGMHKEKIPIYMQEIRKHNINGFVLKNCELPELKNVLNMNFGDWELFRALVNTLRERDEACELDPPSTDDPVPHVKFTQNLNAFDETIEAPKPLYGKKTEKYGIKGL